jgi:hypothetical protein
MLPDLHEAGWRSLTLDASVTVSATGRMPALPASVEIEVDRIWAEARCDRPSLFNGRVFTADRIASDRIEGHWTEYRRVLAQMRRPSLFAAQHTLSLSVNGLIACADGLVLGRRQASALYMPGRWQAAPAGAVESRDGEETVDPRRQVLAELAEELGLGGAAVSGIVPVVAIEHPDSGVVDVGCLIRTGLDFRSIERSWKAHGNREYDALRLVPAGDIPQLLRAPEPDLLVSARILIARWWSLRSSGCLDE